MNPRPILIATCIAIAIVVVVYFAGKSVFETEHHKGAPYPTSTSKPTTLKTPTETTPSHPTTNTSDKQETSVTEQPAPPVDNEATTYTTEADKPKTNKVETETEPVSPHGFGPYPKIPEGAPISRFSSRDPVDMELLGRVMVQKWNEGERFTAGVIEDGKVYLIYPDIIYVQWKEEEDLLTGEKTRYIGGTLGPTDLTHEQITSGEIPPDLQVIDMENAGLDPYDILDLR